MLIVLICFSYIAACFYIIKYEPQVFSQMLGELIFLFSWANNNYFVIILIIIIFNQLNGVT